MTETADLTMSIRGEWIVGDLLWAIRMVRARRLRRRLTFAKRRNFDDALRHPLSGFGNPVVSYPDAFYHATAMDHGRAKETVTDAD